MLTCYHCNYGNPAVIGPVISLVLHMWRHFWFSDRNRKFSESCVFFCLICHSWSVFPRIFQHVYRSFCIYYLFIPYSFASFSRISLHVFKSVSKYPSNYKTFLCSLHRDTSFNDIQYFMQNNYSKFIRMG